MTESEFQGIHASIVQRLSAELDPRLTYHNLAHTLDVLDQALRISQSENISDNRQLLLIRLAALFHDTGFLYVYSGHEARSCLLMRQTLGGLGFSEEELNLMEGMIMATKIPQSPKNLMEKIICDADLDYLGREDFPPISNNLKREFQEFGVIPDAKAWDALQIGFLEKHHYFTKTSAETRNQKKMEHLAQLHEPKGI